MFHKNGEFLVISSYLIGVAAFFDFLDGLTARVLNQYSEFGKELDSLADMVTFGVVPGVIMYQLIFQALPENNLVGLALFSSCIPICSALRLAKFNVGDNQINNFIGLPTPANAIFIGSLPLVMEYDQWGLGYQLSNPGILLTITGVVSFLLVSPIEMFSLKFKDLGWSGNKLRYIFLLISIGFLMVLHFTALPFIIILYALLSTVKFVVGKNSENLKGY